MGGRSADWRRGGGTGGDLGRLAVPDGPAPDQPVAPARRRLQHASIRAERLADRGYVNVERVVPDDGARPDAPHQIILGDELTPRPGQDLDDLERAVAEDAAAARPKLTSAEIDLPWLARVDQIWISSGILVSGCESAYTWPKCAARAKAGPPSGIATPRRMYPSIWPSGV